MRIRGDTYHHWTSCQAHCHCHDETLSNGKEIDVRVRSASTGTTQIFIGVYAQYGMMHIEEAHDAPSSHTMIQAMKWGICRARALATGIAAPKLWDIPQTLRMEWPG